MHETAAGRLRARASRTVTLALPLPLGGVPRQQLAGMRRRYDFVSFAVAIARGSCDSARPRRDPPPVCAGAVPLNPHAPLEGRTAWHGTCHVICALPFYGRLQSTLVPPSGTAQRTAVWGRPQAAAAWHHGGPSESSLTAHDSAHGPPLGRLPGCRLGIRRTRRRPVQVLPCGPPPGRSRWERVRVRRPPTAYSRRT